MKTTQSIKAVIMTVMASVAMSAAAQTDKQESIILYSYGQVVFSDLSENIDSVALENSRKQVSLYDKQKNKVFSIGANLLDSIKFHSAPKADMFDVEFRNDGSAADISPMKNAIQAGSQAPETYYDAALGRFVGRFSNAWGGGNSYCYYRMDYGDNQTFMDGLADGHTLEALVKPEYEGEIKDVECKFFASHEAGGTGLMVCKKDRGLNGGNELTFLPNVSENGRSSWQWGVSGVTPESGKWYHVVGVYDKANGKIHVYVNGILRNSVSVRGSYVFQKPEYRWFCIGADAGPTGQIGWRGEVALARIYNAPLTASDVSALWNNVKDKVSKERHDLVSGVSYLNAFPVKGSAQLSISGKGFEQGDKVRISNVSNDGGIDETLTATITSDGISVRLPEGMTDGRYRLMLIRGEEMQDLGTITVNAVQTMPHPAHTVAHRGYWNTEGAAQNSRTALRKAIEAGMYGVETDIWLNADGELFINHDPSFNGVTIKNATSYQCENLTLGNGEKMPRLSDFFNIMKEKGGKTILVIEIKDHGSDALNKAAASSAVKAVRESGLRDRCEYISFSSVACEQVVKDDPEAKVAYLSGDKSPAELHEKGYTGIDYHQNVITSHPEWVEEAHRLGMTVNVWTVNGTEDMMKLCSMGVDLITTDNPVAASLLEKYLEDNK